jgi:uncharacterized membrane protein YphA (DoxX/SURF4 family)
MVFVIVVVVVVVIIVVWWWWYNIYMKVSINNYKIKRTIMICGTLLLNRKSFT